MEAKKKKQQKFNDLAFELGYPVKKEIAVNMCSAGAVAQQDHSGERLQK